MEILQYTPEVYHLTFGRHPDTFKMYPGQSIQLHLPDCDGLDANGKRLPVERFEQSNYYDIMIGNPAGGPFYIEGARPGDTVIVHIDNISIDRNFGRTGLSQKQIHIPPKLLITDEDVDFNVQMPREVRRWQINTQANTATMELPNSRVSQVTLELDPFPGAVAVAPPNGEFIHTLKSGVYGGNMDIPALKIGSCIHLPVFTEGAMLFLGDIHAAQGDGEVIGGGIEVGGSIIFRVEVVKNKKIASPRIESDNEIGAVGTGENIHSAMEMAFAQLVMCLVQDYGFERWDALHLVSQTAKASPGNFRTAYCGIAKKYLQNYTDFANRY
jgi:acetamidase/formamidase